MRSGLSPSIRCISTFVPLDMTEEVMPEADTRVGSFDQPRDVDQNDHVVADLRCTQ